MQNYKIFTDATCDLTPQQVEECDVRVMPMEVVIGGQSFLHYPDEREMSLKEFYTRLRSGETATTVAISMGTWEQVLEEELKNGSDLLLVIFSSALSSTYNNAKMAADELKEKYPERKIVIVDTLCESLGVGMLTRMASKWRAEGKTIEENATLLERIKLKIHHWFTVDDLGHLRRGGRISMATAIVGQALGIKPILHMDGEGRLVAVGKVRGRKHAIKEIINRMEALAEEPANQDVFIIHADCPEDGEALRQELLSRIPVKSVTINQLGPLAGAHAGPGTLAVFFIGKHRASLNF
jgi:DegV family protein with EDD domain